MGTALLADLGGKFDLLHLRLRRLELFPEGLIEFVQNHVPLKGSLFNLIQPLLHAGGKIDVDDLGKVLLHQVNNNKAQLRRGEGLFLPDHVTAADDGFNNRHIGARPADPLFFEGFDQRGIVVAGRWLGKVLLGQKLHQGQLLPFLHGGQHRLFLLIGSMVNLQESGKNQARAGRLEPVFPGANIDAHLVVNRGGHLAGNKSLPDQLVKAGLIPGQEGRDSLGGVAQHGGADGLVSLLGALAGAVLRGPGR